MQTREVLRREKQLGWGAICEGRKPEIMQPHQRTAVLTALLLWWQVRERQAPLLEFLLQPLELTSTPVNADLKAGHVCSQLQTLPEAGSSLP